MSRKSKAESRRVVGLDGLRWADIPPLPAKRSTKADRSQHVRLAMCEKSLHDELLAGVFVLQQVLVPCELQGEASACLVAVVGGECLPCDFLLDLQERTIPASLVLQGATFAQAVYRQAQRAERDTLPHSQEQRRSEFAECRGDDVKRGAPPDRAHVGLSAKVQRCGVVVLHGSGRHPGVSCEP